MGEALLVLCHEVEDVAIELADGEDELDKVAVWGVDGEGVHGQEGQRAVYECRDGLHTYGERVRTGGNGQMLYAHLYIECLKKT